MKKSSDWTRNILGEMTVMNADEVSLLIIFMFKSDPVDVYESSNIASTVTVGLPHPLK